MEQEKWKRKSIYLVLVLVVVFVILYGIFAWVGDRIAIKNLTEKKDFKSAAEYENYTRLLDLAYKNDKYGSTTPEGTLELFVEALKKGDTDLAAKYFVPEKQKKMAEDLKVGMKSGGVEVALGLLSLSAKKHYYDYDKTYEFSFSKDEKLGSLIVGFKQNKYSQKWKIESL